MSNRLKSFAAWCSGIGYRRPDAALFVDDKRQISISSGGHLYGSFYFQNKDEYGRAKKIFQVNCKKLVKP